MSARGARAALAAAAVVLLTTSCAEDDSEPAEGAGASESSESSPTDDTAGTEETSSPSDGETSAEGASDQCALLDDATVQRLTGEPLEGQDWTITGSDIAACMYGELSSVGVQVFQVSADVWAKQLPVVVDQLKAMGALGSDRLMKQLEQGAELIEAGRELPPGRACDLFGQMIELQGASSRRGFIVNYVPDGTDPQAISGQACVDGTYSSVTVGRPDIEVGGQLQSDVEAALMELTQAS